MTNGKSVSNYIWKDISQNQKASNGVQDELTDVIHWNIFIMTEKTKPT
jgi:hypothetical protein